MFPAWNGDPSAVPVESTKKSRKLGGSRTRTIYTSDSNAASMETTVRVGETYDAITVVLLAKAGKDSRREASGVKHDQNLPRSPHDMSRLR